MALLRIDSFDHYLTADLPAKGWSISYSAAVAPSISAGNGRNGTACFRLQQNSTSTWAWATKALAPSGATFVCGFAFKINSLAQTFPIMGIWDGGYIQGYLEVTTSGALKYYKGYEGFPGGQAQTSDGTVLITTAAILTATVYAFIELKVVIHQTTGTAEIKVNGTSVGTFTGDTRATVNASWTGMMLGASSGTNAGVVTLFDYDDLYVCDGTGATHNDFLGDHRIVALVASAGNGTLTDWTPSTGSDHGALVDETTPNTSDYNSSNTVGQIDTYNFPAVGVVGTVKGVQTTPYMKADVSGIRTVVPAFRIGGANQVGTGQVLGSEWTYVQEIHQVSPATAAAWTVSEIDGAEFGVKVTV